MLIFILINYIYQKPIHTCSTRFLVWKRMTSNQNIFFFDKINKNNWLIQKGNIKLEWIKNKPKVKHKKKGGNFCGKS